MSKKKHVNRQFWTVAVLTAVFHLLILVIVGGLTVYKIVSPPEAEFKAPPPVEALDLLPLEYQANLDRLQSASEISAPQEQIVAQNMDLNLPSINLDAIGPVASAANVRVGGNMGRGLGGGGGLGFASTAFDFLGIRSQGERVVIIIETSEEMLLDTKGGIDAYEIIKNEAERLFAGLPPGTLFNIFFTDRRNSVHLFSDSFVAATPSSKEAIMNWIRPINTDRTGQRVASVNFIAGGHRWRVGEDSIIRNIESRGILYALEAAFSLKADTIFLIVAGWPPIRGQEGQGRGPEAAAEWRRIQEEWRQRQLANPRIAREYEAWRERQRTMNAEAQRIFDEENARRMARGEAARVITGMGTIIQENNLREKFNVPFLSPIGNPPSSGEGGSASSRNLDIRDVQRIVTESIRHHYDVGDRPQLNLILYGTDGNAQNFEQLRRVGRGGVFRQMEDGRALQRARSHQGPPAA
jgi:hypothetical protein